MLTKSPFLTYYTSGERSEIENSRSNQASISSLEEFISCSSSKFKSTLVSYNYLIKSQQLDRPGSVRKNLLSILEKININSGKKPPDRIDNPIVTSFSQISSRSEAETNDTLQRSNNTFQQKSNPKAILYTLAISIQRLMINHRRIFLSIAILFVSLLIFKLAFGSKNSRLIYCNTYKPFLGCIPCPSNGICRNGDFKECNSGYTKEGEVCVDEAFQLGKQILPEILLMIKERSIDFCRSRSRTLSFISLNDMKQLISLSFPEYSPEMKERILLALSLRFQDAAVQMEHHIQIVSLEPLLISSSLPCIEQQETYSFITLSFGNIIFIGVAIFCLYWAKQLWDNFMLIRIANNLYGQIYSQSKLKKGNFQAKPIIERLRKQYDRAKFQKIWRYFERICKLERQTFHLVRPDDLSLLF